MDTIRAIKESDYPILEMYWQLAGHNAQAKEMYPLSSSYVYEQNGSILYAVALYCIKDLNTAYVEAVIRNPYQKANFEAIKALQDYLEKEAKLMGYKRIIASPLHVTLSKHYEKLGYNNVGAIMLMAKEL